MICLQEECCLVTYLPHSLSQMALLSQIAAYAVVAVCELAPCPSCVAGMCGFSMGGVHASMVASLYPGNIACTPLLAPRSASGAFCHGALRSATSWAPLAAVVDEKQQVILYSQLLGSMNPV